MKNKVSINIDHTNVKIYINQILHLNFDFSNYVGMQSFITTDNLYHIEIYLKRNCKIMLEYSDVSLWKDILKLIDANL